MEIIEIIETFEANETSSITFTMRKLLNSSMFPRFGSYSWILCPLVALVCGALALTIKHVTAVQALELK
jgi:hypothetical protein